MRLLLSIILFLSVFGFAQDETGFQIARLKYEGGGDWYNDQSAEKNLLRFVNQNTNIKVNPDYTFVDISSDNIFSYPFLFMTGHGNVVFSSSEVERLRNYLTNGGFLYIDDDYGLNDAIRREMKKVFPDKEFVEIPFSHDIYHIVYDFEYGPPKIHKHDEKVPQGFGIFYEGELVVYFTFESNPSDGWADQRVHNDPELKREESLKFGTNLVVYALTK